MHREILIFVIVLLVCALIIRAAQKPEPSPSTDPTTASSPAPTMRHTPVDSDIQVALILDTSSSMDGLIRQAREQILEIVADLQQSETGQPKTIALALYRYGTDKASSNDGFTECLVPLTTDYSGIVDALGRLRAGGQEEYAPLAISTAVSELAWNSSPSIPKVIVIVGNESFSDGPVDARTAFAEAKQKKIKVLPIYCVGEHASKSALSGWKRAAYLAGTNLEMIDPDHAVAAMERPATTMTPVQMPNKPVPHQTLVPQRPFYPAKAPSETVHHAKPQADLSTGMRRGMKGVLESY
jgi:hypothetical protein